MGALQTEFRASRSDVQPHQTMVIHGSSMTRRDVRQSRTTRHHPLKIPTKDALSQDVGALLQRGMRSLRLLFVLGIWSFAGCSKEEAKETRTGGLAGKLDRLAGDLDKSSDDLTGALVAAGLKLPEKAKEKPVFVEHAGEIFWFNVNAKNELWLNAKASKFAGKDGEAAEGEGGEKKPVRRGGGVVFTLGSQVDAEAFNRLLFNKGNGIVPARLVKRIRASEGQHFTLTGDDEAFQQPPLAAFSADNDRGTLLAARIREYYQVELPAKVAVKKWLSFLPPQGVKPGAGAKTTLDPAMLEWRRHRGRVMLITTTMNIDWGSWPGSPAFLPLAHELARHAALGAPPRVVATGESLLDYLPSQLGRLGGTVATPDGRTAAVALEGQEDAAVFRFPETHHSGIYRLVVGAGKREYMFAVNPPASTATATASESDLNRIAPGEMESGPDDDVQVVVDLSEIKIKARALATNQDGETPRSSAGPAVARYLLLAFLTLLVVEMVLAWRFGSARTVAVSYTHLTLPTNREV